MEWSAPSFGNLTETQKYRLSNPLEIIVMGCYNAYCQAISRAPKRNPIHGHILK
jgi:hypothetical protein